MRAIRKQLQHVKLQSDEFAFVSITEAPDGDFIVRTHLGHLSFSPTQLVMLKTLLAEIE